MRNFQQVAAGIDVFPLLHALARQSDLWNADRTRTTFDDSPHAAVDDVLVRFGGLGADNVGDVLQCEWTDVVRRLPQVRDIVFPLMASLRAEQLGRIVITRLPPGGRIAAHKDVLGEYSKYYSRYHVVLQGLPGSMFRAGEETVCMQTGEVWWFDAAQVHEIVNNSSDDRIHLLIDLRVSA
jgi:hypothetical protein